MTRPKTKQPKEKGLSSKDRKEYQKQYKILNKKRINAANLARYHKNKVLVPTKNIKHWNKKDDPELPDTVLPTRKPEQSKLEYRKEYSELNKERIAILRQRTYVKNRQSYLDRSRKSHQAHMEKHGISKATFENNKSQAGADKRCDNWTLEDEKLVMSGKYGDRDLAKMLSRTISAVGYRRYLIKNGGGETNDPKPPKPLADPSLPKIIKPERQTGKFDKKKYSKEYYDLNRDRELILKRKKYRENFVSKHPLGKAHRTIEDPTLPDIIKLDRSIFETETEGTYRDEWLRLNRERIKILQKRNYDPEKNKERNLRYQQRCRNEYGGVLKCTYENDRTVPGAYDRWQAWTLREIEIVESGKYTDEELTKIIGRTLAAVKWRRFTLGMKKRKRKLNKY